MLLRESTKSYYHIEVAKSIIYYIQLKYENINFKKIILTYRVTSIWKEIRMTKSWIDSQESLLKASKIQKKEQAHFIIFLENEEKDYYNL